MPKAQAKAVWRKVVRFDEAPAVADKVSSSAVADKANKTDRKLHPFTGPEGGNFPGQLWWSYRSVKEDENWPKKDFKARLTEMLQPTTNDDEYVAWFQQNQGKGYCPFLRSNKNDGHQ